MAELLSSEKARLILPESRLSIDSDEESVQHHVTVKRRWRSFMSQSTLRAFTYHILFAVFYTGVITWLVYFSHQKGPSAQDLPVYDPARDHVSYEVREFDWSGDFQSDTKKPFGGPPSQQLDDNWDKLLRFSNLRIHEDEWDAMPHLADGIKLPDGGYYGTSSFFHSLHCIKRLHQDMYRMHYFPNLTEAEERLMLKHGEHCLDILRQSVLCTPDTTMQAFRFVDSSALPANDMTNAHACVNWDSLEAWARARSINPFKKDYIVHPKFGWAYAPEHRNRVGVAH